MNKHIDPGLYQRNIQLIQEIYPQYAETLSSTENESEYRIEEAFPNAFTCRHQTHGNWIHGPENPWEEAEKAIQASEWTQQQMFLVLRPGLGYVPFSLYPNLRKGRNAQRMLLVEDQIDLFNESLKRFDWTDVLRSDRTILILDSNPLGAIVDFFVKNPVSMLPPFTGMCGVVVNEMEQEMMKRLREVATEMTEKVHGAAKGYLNDLSSHYASIANDPTHQKRVLLVEPEHEYLAGAIEDAFRDEKWQVNIFNANTRLLHFLNPFIWLVYTRETFPDVLLWMNRNTLSPEGGQVLKDYPIKKVLWYLDSPKRVQTTKEELDATDAYFSFDPSYLPYLQELSGKPGYYLPTAAGIRPLPECEPRAAWPQRQGPDVGFMGALAAQRYQKVLEFWQRRDAEYVQILDGIIEDYLADPTRSLEERYNASPGRDRLPYAGFVVLYLEERVTYLKRVRTLHCVNDLGLVTYGAAEWKEPAWAENLVDCYSGEMPRYREDLPRVYYHTKININIFHAQCINSTNPRVYDVLAAGGFLLTEYKPILEEEFQQEKHLVWYHSPEEMREKVVYYLEQEDEREAIARAGQEYVLQHATYKQRIQTMIDTIENDKTQI